MSTLDIIEKKEEQSEEDTTSWKSKITFDKIKKEMDRPNVFFTVALLELLIFFIACAVIVYFAFNL